MRMNWHAPWWAWLLTLTVCACFLALGNWQLHRAQEKRAIIAAYARVAQQPPRPLAAADQAGLAPLHASITGVALIDRQLLLDSQTRAGKAGYDVWLPVRVSGLPALVLVDRGWVAAGAAGQLPQVALNPNLQGLLTYWPGLWRQLPRPGLRLGHNDCKQGQWPHVVQYPTRKELQCLLGAPVMPGVLLLDPQASNGLLRDWRSVAVSMPPRRHVAYAVQWFAMALALWVLFFLVNRRKSA